MTQPEPQETAPGSPSPAVPATTSPEISESGAPSAQAVPPRPKRVRAVAPRSLHQFTDTKNLVTVMLDAITAHKSLYEVGGVLHGDINNNTILILGTADGESKGALVDFDMPCSMPAIPKSGDIPPSQRIRPYYWRAPGV